MKITLTSLSAVAGLCLASQSALAVPVYSLQTIGLYDAEFTRYDGYQYSRPTQANANGYVAGRTNRYGSFSVGYNGQAAWIYNGINTTRIGLTGEEFTSSNNRQYSSAFWINNNGYVAGLSALRGGDNRNGWGAWLYNGNSTVRIGLVDNIHRSLSGQTTKVIGLSDSGYVIGTSIRRPRSFSIIPPSGQSAWLYDGSNTRNIGLTDAEHTGLININSTDDYRYSEVTRLNNAGQAIGRSVRLNGAVTEDAIGYSAWLYSGGTTTRIGLTGAGYTRDDDYKSSEALFLNEAGQTVGYSDRYTGSSSLGRNAWSYKDGITRIIGLTDAIHTRDDGYQYSLISGLNQRGSAIGSSWRYSGSDRSGSSAWIYKGGNTIEIGLTGPLYTNRLGLSTNYAVYLNEADQVAGRAGRYDGAVNGQSTWFYSGKSTVEIGLYDAEHTSELGTKRNDIIKMNEAGKVLGKANRYNGTTAYQDQTLGQSIWLYNPGPGVTTRIGLTGMTYMRDDGYAFNSADKLNAASQVAGYAKRFEGGSADLGQTVWFYDTSTGTTYFNDFSIRPSDGYAFSTAEFLGEDGLMLGYYELFDASSSLLGNRAFAFTIEDGFFDLGQQISGDLASFDWEYLAQTFSADLTGSIVGTGKLSGVDGQAVYLLSETSAVPLPAAVWLFGSGLLGLLGIAKRNNRRPAPA